MNVVAIILAGGGILLLAFAWPAWWRERPRRFAEEQERLRRFAEVQERHWDSSPIDVTPVAQRLERVRADYVAAIHPLDKASRSFHEQFLDAARQAVSNLSYFRRRRRKPDESARRTA
jgi:hypothetical protein